MTAFVLTEDNLARVKRNLRPLLPDVKSSHVSEALAAALGCRTHAALLEGIAKRCKGNPDIIGISGDAFISRLKSLGASAFPETSVDGVFERIHFRDAPSLIRTSRREKGKLSYKTPRAKAWRNLMVSAINAGIEQKLFSIRKDDNRWPEANTPKDHGFVYHFDFYGIPALGYVKNIGFGELAIHAALKPTPDGELFVRGNMEGFYAGEAFGMAWLERDDGAYLQASLAYFRVRKPVQSLLANAEIKTKGYGDRGRVVM